MKYENVTMKGNANEFRFSLTKEGDRKLVVFGVNPSTANEQIADLTITKVMGYVLLEEQCTRRRRVHCRSREIRSRSHFETLINIQLQDCLP